MDDKCCVNQSYIPIDQHIGLTASQLNIVYPYHVIIQCSQCNSDTDNNKMTIKQLGTKWFQLIDTTSLIDSPVSDHFTINTPLRCRWDLNDLLIRKDSEFDISFASLSRIKRSNIAKIPLSGSFILSQSNMNTTHIDSISGKKEEQNGTSSSSSSHSTTNNLQSTIHTNTGDTLLIFLLSLRFPDPAELCVSGFTLSDLSRYTFQRENIMLGMYVYHITCTYAYI